MYVLAATEAQRRVLQGEIDRRAGQGHGIKVETESSFGWFDWERLSGRGMHPNCVVLVDHYAIESKFAVMLEMLHRYDVPRTPEPDAPGGQP